MRYDQFMRFGWKVLIPVNLVWILVLAGVRVARNELGRSTQFAWIIGVVIVIVLVTLVWPTAKKAEEPTIDEQLAARPPGSFPVPPMDLQVPPSPRARRAVAERAPATVGGGTTTDADADEAPDKEV
jgi:NADH-quinone oxidoreductase subunit H